MEIILYYVVLIYIQRYPGFKFLEKNFIPFLGRLPSHQSMLIPRKTSIAKYV